MILFNLNRTVAPTKSFHAMYASQLRWTTVLCARWVILLTWLSEAPSPLRYTQPYLQVGGRSWSSSPVCPAGPWESSLMTGRQHLWSSDHKLPPSDCNQCQPEMQMGEACCRKAGKKNNLKNNQLSKLSYLLVLMQTMLLVFNWLFE